MKNEDKLRLADQVIRFIEELSEGQVNMPVMVGTLKRVWGLNGFKKAEIGTPVFEFNDRYIIYLETLNGDRNVEVPFYKDTLKPVIEFI